MLSRLSRLEYKWLVAIVFMFGLFMDMLDSTAVNVAVPRLQADFHAPLTSVEWAVTGYLLSLALFVPGAGFIADRFGSKRTFLTAMTIFVAGSALCGLSQNIEQLIAFRFLQGVGGGMMTPVSTAILSREFPGEERAKASALISVPVILAPVAGPVLGGYLVEAASWRWIFYINLPVGIIGFFLAINVLREHVEPYARGRFDVAGLLTGGGGVAMILYALSVAADHPWTSPGVAYWGLAGIACLVVFAVIELRVSPPILDLRLFKQRLFAVGNATNALSFASFSGLFLILTLFIQELQGRSPLVTGFIQAPSAVASALALALAGRIYGRIGPRRMMLFGYVAGMLTVLPLLLVDKATGPWVFALLLVSRGLVTPFAMIAAQTIVYGPLDNSKQGPASSIYNTNRQIAASFGVALMATVELSRFHTHLAQAAAAAHVAQTTQAMVDHAQVMGYHDTFVVSAALMILAAVGALFVNDRRARAAMRQRVGVALDEQPAAQPAPALAE